MEPGKSQFLINLQISLVAEYQNKVKSNGYFNSQHSLYFSAQKTDRYVISVLYCISQMFCEEKKRSRELQKTTQDCWKLPPREAKYDFYAKLRIELLEPDLQINSSSFQYEN